MNDLESKVEFLLEENNHQRAWMDKLLDRIENLENHIREKEQAKEKLKSSIIIPNMNVRLK